MPPSASGGVRARPPETVAGDWPQTKRSSDSRLHISVPRPPRRPTGAMRPSSFAFRSALVLLNRQKAAASRVVRNGPGGGSVGASRREASSSSKADSYGSCDEVRLTGIGALGRPSAARPRQPAPARLSLSADHRIGRLRRPREGFSVLRAPDRAAPVAPTQLLSACPACTHPRGDHPRRIHDAPHEDILADDVLRKARWLKRRSRPDTRRNDQASLSSSRRDRASQRFLDRAVRRCRPSCIGIPHRFSVL